MASDEIIELGDGKFLLKASFAPIVSKSRSKHHGKNRGCDSCGYSWTDCPECPVCHKPFITTKELS